MFFIRIAVLNCTKLAVVLALFAVRLASKQHGTLMGGLESVLHGQMQLFASQNRQMHAQSC